MVIRARSHENGHHLRRAGGGRPEQREPRS